MKTILSVILALAIGDGYSQGNSASLCDTRLLTQFDSVKEVYVRNVKDDIVLNKDDKNKLTIALFEMEKTIIMSVVIAGAGDCVDETNKITIVFKDGTKIEMLNNGGFNCDAEFSVFFGGVFGHKKELGMLAQKEIQSIKATTRKSSIDKARNNIVEVIVPPEIIKTLMESFDCLTK